MGMDKGVGERWGRVGWRWGVGRVDGDRVEIGRGCGEMVWGEGVGRGEGES